ncbi:MAG: AmmeMemoRadiSam system protein A [Woeseiaceae bacterium]|nr:AmmeMemoRadiSam system protein A [Woeseiaceae bacterium]
MHSIDQQCDLGADLLRLARGSIEHGLAHNEPLPIRFEGMPDVMTDPAATFTTLRLNGKLRGCVGNLESERPLARDVAHTAFRAAFRDPRFEPVVQHELSAILVEVAVLSPMEPFAVRGEAELLARLEPGEDGLVIGFGAKRATFLPKVWEQLPKPAAFLAALKMKCGLEKDFWSQQLEFHRYKTTTYTELAEN